MSSPPSLPTPRQLLTSILNAIARIPAPAQQQQQQAQGQASTASGAVDPLQGGDEAQPAAAAAATATNPLRLIGPAHRPLFTTLHVLFPSLLLPALDLLDRGLVARLIPGVDDGTAGGGGGRRRQGGGDVEMRDGGDGGGPTRQTAQPPPPPSPVYLVRSAQKPTRRPFGGGGGGGGGGGDPAATGTQRAYVVHTAAWNCTCAAFAFSAFPPAAGWSSLALGRTGPTVAEGKGKGKGKGEGKGEDEDHAPFGLRAAVEEDGEEDIGEGPAGWQFGGLGHDGDVDGDGEAVPPCCKHLLACVLAERWDAALGRSMVRRTIAREEMAGIFADI